MLAGVSLGVAAGEIIDVAGPSGAGKSTLLHALARLLPGVSGELSLGGRPASDFSPQEWRSNVALLPQKPAMADGDVRHNLLLPWEMRIRRDEAPPAIDVLRRELVSLALGEVAPDRDVSRLSVGQQARIALLRVVLTSPRVLLLDEPDAALDSISAQAVAERLRVFASGGGAVIRVRHREDDGLASRRLTMRAGVLDGGAGA